jgi:capsular exopolysaccharide synthesis family protein
LGKFFDAMQRARESGREATESGKAQKHPLPELDEDLLRPEGTTEGDHPDQMSEDEPIPFKTAVLETTSEDIGLRDVQPRQQGDEVAEPVVRVSGAQGGGEVGGPQPAARPSFASLRRLRTDVFRRPLEAAYERIIQRLFAYRRSPRESVILVTSAVAGEGTSTVARNVALALAQHRAERVLLIDANLRTPSQHRAFKMDMTEGLGDVLLGPTTLTSAVQEDVAPGLSLLPAGQSVASPAQLLTVASLHSVIMALLSLYDWIIIDSPPATSYPDVATIAAAAGGAILVVEAEETRLEVVEEAKRVLETSGVDLLGAVLNKRRYHIPNLIYKRL